MVIPSLPSTVLNLLPADVAVSAAGERIQEKARRFFGIETGTVLVGERFLFNEGEAEEIEAFAREVLSAGGNWRPVFGYLPDGPGCSVLVGKRPGVTDDAGMSAHRAFMEFLGKPVEAKEQTIFTETVYFFANVLEPEALRQVAHALLGNPLVNAFAYNGEPLPAPTYGLEASDMVEAIGLNLDDTGLLALSAKRHLALNLAEMRAIQAHYQEGALLSMREALGLPPSPTDCELEILAQTWSEHCKHKEFNARITYTDVDAGHTRVIDSLFKTKIMGATKIVEERLREHGLDWLVKVFSDNAGIVKVRPDLYFTWKVETHNTPSALDPYGGAITGILGCNRDAVGTGVGGARALFNTNVLCFAPPNYAKPLLRGQLHPSWILEGVVEGIMDGGNKMGIPTVNGSIHFDERYAGKPLVFCGTGALMPAEQNGLPTEAKPIVPGDLIVMAGGRVGKDGIHGATLSSVEADGDLPLGMVQIGSPATQKCLFDFLEEAVRRGLVKTCTDNGAGGLSSSVGELAEITQGAEVHLERVPLKYAGLKPWEVFLSESQERMTLVVAPGVWQALQHLAEEFAVEVSDIGRFTESGYLDVQHAGKRIAYLDMDFMHSGVPQKELVAEWKAPDLKEPDIVEVSDYTELLKALLASYNICSRESVIRRYDHEVKGRSIVKPLMGLRGEAPQDAAVVRLGFENFRGLAVSNGIMPQFGDLDAYHMSAGAFDEAVRSIIAVGGRLPDPTDPNCPAWTVNDNFCVPDSVYDAQKNPDGKYKLAQLVRMCDGLYDMATAYNIPLTSGKDSMKNDFRDGEVKISVQPTVLYSMVSTIEDVRTVTTAEFKAAGDLVYILGETYNELGGSAFYKHLGHLGAHVPKVRKERAAELYRRVSEAHADGLLVSCHDLSDGGLAVALAEAAFGGNCGVKVKLDYVAEDLNQALFSESHSRFVVSIQRGHKERFEALFLDRAHYLGEVTQEPRFIINYQGKRVVDTTADLLLDAWKGGLVW